MFIVCLFDDVFFAFFYLEIWLVVAVYDPRQKISQGLARTCLGDPDHVLKRINWLILLLTFICKLVC